MAILSAAEAAGIRTALGVLLTHSYSRESVADGAANAWNEPADTYGTATTALPCRYRPTTRLRTDEGGSVVVAVPTLVVPAADPVKPGDRVSNVQDGEGVVLLAGPAAVESVEASAGLGPTLQKRAILRSTDIT